MNNRKVKRMIMLISLISIISNINVYAHPGNTDDNGGHYDYNNESELGEYHFHHGYRAHLHINGCEYEESIFSELSSDDESIMEKWRKERNSNEANEAVLKQDSFNKGYNDGVLGKSNSYEKNTFSYFSYLDGYEKGHAEYLEKEQQKLEQKKKDKMIRNIYILISICLISIIVLIIAKIFKQISANRDNY